MSLNRLIEKGNICLENREKISSAPLWHMGKVAVFESKESFDLLQNTIDYLTCKGKLGKKFSNDEKEFMKELFEAMWWGGKYVDTYRRPPSWQITMLMAKVNLSELIQMCIRNRLLFPIL